MSCFLLFDNNYVDSARANSITASSANASYPITNAYAFARRHKTWRSAGYWLVTSSNNKIVFRDDTSTNITATITAGAYTSASAFLSAIDTALEAVGAAAYTVSQDATTGKIKLLSDLSGGATAFQLITTHADFTAAGILGFDTSINHTGAAFYLADELVIHQKEFVLIDMGVSTRVQACALIGKRNTQIQLSPSAVIKIQGNTTSNFDNPQFEATLSYNEQAIYTANSDGLDSYYRFWRVYFEDADNVNGYIELSNIFVGEVWAPERGAAQFGFQNDLEDLSVTVFTENGVSLSQVKPQRQSLIFDFDFMTKADAERLQQIFDEFGTVKQFFIAMDNNEAFTTESELMLKYVKFADAPTITLDTPNNFSAQLRLREEL
jgi:hypothetical protein